MIYEDEKEYVLNLPKRDKADWFAQRSFALSYNPMMRFPFTQLQQ